MNYSEAKSQPGVNLIEFYASWCPHCQRMKPVVDEVKKLIGSTAAVYQYDIDRHPSCAESAGAHSVPTFIIYRNGKEMWRHAGEISSDELVAAINSAR